MIKRIISRLVVLAVVLFGVTLLTFFYTSLSPVDAGQALAVRRYTRPTAEQIPLNYRNEYAVYNGDKVASYTFNSIPNHVDVAAIKLK